jgi:hypothetical protein
MDARDMMHQAAKIQNLIVDEFAAQRQFIRHRQSVTKTVKQHAAASVLGSKTLWHGMRH